MSGKTRIGFFPTLISALVIIAVSGFLATSAAGQDARVSSHSPALEQPLYRDYRGVRLGMTADEIRAKLGRPTVLADDQDYYIVSPNETVQIAYDASHKVIAISADYLGGIGAPDFRTVVGPVVELRPDGSSHKMVVYEKLGFWVSYHRSAGSVPMVTVTMQRTAD